MLTPTKKVNFDRQGYMGNRPDILSLIPPDTQHILDIGCGAGIIGKKLKERSPSIRTCGIDGDKDLINLAKKNLDTVYHADLNDLSIWRKFEDKSFDVIIFADVLEHLISPDKVLKEACKKLRREGYIITCIPNIRHWSTFWHLYIRGSWPRNSRGLFDKTHLRFFTKKNIVDLLSNAGLEIIREKRNVRIIEPWSWTNIPGKLFDFWPFRPVFTFQYIHMCSLKREK